MSSAKLEVKNIGKVFFTKNKKKIYALKNISFEAEPGEILGILGPNGAGKTTLVKIISNLIKPNQGNIFIGGESIFTNKRKSLANISVVLEGNRNIYWQLSVKENLEFFLALKGKNPAQARDKIDYYLDLFDLKAKENETARKLSRGMQQKLAIAIALVVDSEIIILDEPTLGLDVKTSYEIRKLLQEVAKNEAKTILVTSHNMNFVEDICDKVIIINQGEIIAKDSIDNLLDIFNVKTYEIIIKEKLSLEQKELLSQLDNVLITAKNNKNIIKFSFENPAMLYKVIDILRQNQATIISIKEKENNFEEIFLKITEGSESSEKLQTSLA